MPISWRKTYTSQHLVLKYTEQFPKIDPDKYRYDLNVWSQYWERVETFMKLTATDPDTSALLLW